MSLCFHHFHLADPKVQYYSMVFLEKARDGLYPMAMVFSFVFSIHGHLKTAMIEQSETTRNDFHEELEELSTIYIVSILERTMFLAECSNLYIHCDWKNNQTARSGEAQSSFWSQGGTETLNVAGGEWFLEAQEPPKKGSKKYEQHKQRWSYFCFNKHFHWFSFGLF